jgi:predicted  nucleic acid-binding Zn-ribbon protein
MGISVDDVYAGVNALEKRIDRLEWETERAKDDARKQLQQLEEFRTMLAQHRELVAQSLDEFEKSNNTSINSLKDRIDEKFNKLYFVILGIFATLVGGMAMYIVTQFAG